MIDNISSNFNHDKNAWEVRLKGEFDIFNSADLKEALVKLVNDSEVDLHIHCDELSFLDSTAIGTLVSVYNVVAKYKGKIVLYDLHSNLLKLLRITNLDNVFEIKAGDANE